MAVEPYAIAGINTLGNLAATAMTNSANREIMREQQRWSEEMWQKQNAYNSPMAQMARLREAGINPALAYASGQPENTATSLPEQAESAKMIPFRMDLDPNMVAQSNLLDAQAESARADAALKLAMAPESAQRIAESKQRVEESKQNIALMQQQISESVARINNLDEQNATEQRKRQNIAFEEIMRSKEFDELVKVNESIVNLNNVNSEKAKADAAHVRRLTKELIETFEKRLRSMDDQHQLTQEEINKVFEEVGLLNFQKQREQIGYEHDAMMRYYEEEDKIYRAAYLATGIISKIFSMSMAKIK